MLRVRSRADSEIRRVRETRNQLRRRNVQLSARYFRGSGRQHLGLRRESQERQGRNSDEVQFGGKTPDDVRQARSRGRWPRYVQRTLRRFGGAEWRYLRRRWTWRRYQRADREADERRQVHQGVG